jgi:long-chain acyl-CoA synthetase
VAAVGDTLPKLLIANAQRYGQHKTAMREKAYGIWQAYSWAQYLEQVRDLHLASPSGFQHDKLAIIGDNAGCTGRCWRRGARVPVPSIRTPAPGLRHHHSDAKMVLAEDQEQVDKSSRCETAPQGRYVIYDDPKNASLLVSVSAQLRRGPGAGPPLEITSGPMSRLCSGDRARFAIINHLWDYRRPKGVMLTHRNLIKTASYLQVDPLSQRDEIMAYLPMAWISDTFFSVVPSFPRAQPSIARPSTVAKISAKSAPR